MAEGMGVLTQQAWDGEKSRAPVDTSGDLIMALRRQQSSDKQLGHTVAKPFAMDNGHVCSY
jgi:hypothetical protein